jgi:hypothetical protein
MIRFLILGVFLIFLSIVFGQNSQSNKQDYKENQFKLDQNYGAMGPIFFKPNLGPGAEIPNSWYGVSMLSDIFEIRFALGEANRVQPIVSKNSDLTYPIGNYGKDYGYMLTVGANFPIKFLAFGAYQSPTRIFRGHPTLGCHFGYFNFKEGTKDPGSASLYTFSVNPGYRIRFPFVSLEFNLDARMGFSMVDDISGTGLEFYKGSGISPTFTLRFDAFKGLLNPSMVSVAAQQATVTNVQSDTRRTGTRYSGNTRVDTYITYTTADVTVTNFNIGIQDIGPYFGIGPKFSYMSLRRGNHINMGRLLGVAFEGRMAWADFGATIEAGTIGHGSALEFKDEFEPRRKLNKSKSDAAGTLNTFNFYTNIGIDISQLFLVPFGVVLDKGEATSFLSASAGVIIGGHSAFNQRYDSPEIEASFDEGISANNPDELKNKFVDPSDVGLGYLGGCYFSVHIGALSFKATNYRYYGAPFASTSMFSVAWKFPILYDK